MPFYFIFVQDQYHDTQRSFAHHSNIKYVTLYSIMLSNMHCYAESRGASEIPTNTHFHFVQNKLFLFYLFLIFFSTK
jgi:hypothetical protein